MMLAMLALLDVQVVVLVTSVFVLSEKMAIAVNWRVVPAGRVALSGLISMDCRVAVGVSPPLPLPAPLPPPPQAASPNIARPEIGRAHV